MIFCATNSFIWAQIDFLNFFLLNSVILLNDSIFLAKFYFFFNFFQKILIFVQLINYFEQK